MGQQFRDDLLLHDQYIIHRHVDTVITCLDETRVINKGKDGVARNRDAMDDVKFGTASPYRRLQHRFHVRSTRIFTS